MQKQLVVGKFFYEINSKVFFYDDQVLPITKIKATILDKLCEAHLRKRVVSLDQMITAIYYDDYRNDEPDDAIGLLRVSIINLRKVLNKHTNNSIIVKNLPGTGYYLDFNKEKQLVRDNIFQFNRNSKLSFDDIEKILNLKKQGMGAQLIAKRFGVAKSSIQEIFRKHSLNCSTPQRIKLNFKLAEEIRNLKKEGYSLTELASKYNVGKGNISHIVNNRTWVRK